MADKPKGPGCLEMLCLVFVTMAVTACATLGVAAWFRLEKVEAALKEHGIVVPGPPVKYWPWSKPLTPTNPALH